jgi:hypothetical protein
VINLAGLGTRRALIAALLPALGLHETAEADDCATKCKKKSDKKERKKCLKQCKKARQSPPPPPPPPPPQQQAVQFSGPGPMVGSPFYLVAGRYIATSSIVANETTNFIAWLYGPGASYTADLLVNEIPQAPGSYQYQHVIEIEDTGSHLLEVQDAGGPWTIRLDPVVLG